jgi:phosphopantothenoylcysteine decarboxylase/phosphopantothenate--cysteine ligase
VTAGGTAEPIDAVRVITNLSTGKMGNALARVALTGGAEVTLISSAADPTLFGLRFVPMQTVESLRRALVRECANADLVLMAAAVSDFKPVARRTDKIKKTGERLVLEFEPVPDFMHDVDDDVFKVGFAAECGDAASKAAPKLDRHGFQIICANPIDEPGSGFGSDTNRVTIVERGLPKTELPCLPKTEVAERILDYTKAAFARWRRAGRTDD